MKSFLLLSWFLLLHSTYKPTYATELCSSCEKLVEFTLKVHKTFNNNNQVHEDIVNWCVHSNFGDDYKMCEFLLNNTESSLSNVNLKRFCNGINACHPQYLTVHQPHEEIQIKVANSSTDCEFCINTLTHVKEIISSPATVNEVKSVLASCCEKLQDLKNECLKLIDEELDTIFQFIRDQFDPRQFCIETQACPPRKFFSNMIASNLPRLSDFINILPRTSVVIFNQPDVSKSSPKCSICHLVFKVINEEFKKNKTFAEIEQVLDNVCSKIFKDSSTFLSCQHRVNKYTKEFMNLAATGASAEVACLIIGACDTKETNGIVFTPVVPAHSIYECELCKKLFRFFYNVTDGERTQESIGKALAEVCETLFVKEQLITCIQFVNTNTPMITDIMKKSFDSDGACKLIWLCGVSVDLPNNKTLSKLKPVSRISINSICDRFEAQVQSILSHLRESQKFLVSELENICNRLETAPGQCSSLISKINATFDSLQKDAISQSICLSHGICSSSGHQHQSANVEIFESSICSKCKAITRYIEEKVSEYQTEEEIFEFIRNNVCGELPNPVLKETCQSFMVEYGDSFIYKIALKIFDPDVVCSKELHVCPLSLKTKISVNEPSNSKLVKGVLGFSCDLCVNLVSTLESLIFSSVSHVNLSDYAIINQVCSQFTPKEKIEKCKIMYDAFGSHFIQMIGFNEPKKICSTVDICLNNNSHLLGGQKCSFGPAYWCHSFDHANACKATHFCKKNVWKSDEQMNFSSIQDTPQCALCHIFLNIIDKELEKNRTVEQIEVTLGSVCNKIYKDQIKLEKCHEHVAKYTKRFIDLATHGVAPEVACIIFGFCQVIGDSQEALFLQDGKVACSICKSVIQNVYQTLPDSKMREEIDKALENACSLLPDSQKQVCLLYIKFYDTKLAELIARASNADEVCREIGLCSSLGLIDEETADNPNCILCKRIFEFIYSYLQENRTEAAINDALDKVCDEIFPSDHKRSCRKFVDTYTSQIIDIVLQTTDPKEACTILGICKHQITERFLEPMIRIEKRAKTVSLTKLGPKAFNRNPSIINNEKCNNCYHVISHFAQYSENIFASIKTSITRSFSCTKENPKCEDCKLVDFDSKINLLNLLTNADYLCKNLFSICPSRLYESKNPIDSGKSYKNNEFDIINVLNSIFCDKCETFARYIQSQIDNYKTEEEISKFIKTDFCSHFVTHDLKESCTIFISDYGDSIIHMLASKIFDPQIFCSEKLRLCLYPSASVHVFDKLDVKGNETCELCVSMIKKIEVRPNADRKEIINNICSKYENFQMNRKCSSIYDAFGKHFSVMVAFDSAQKICESVDLCYRGANKHLLGGQKCSFGPSYWCNTKAHAKACNALKFCAKKYGLLINE